MKERGEGPQTATADLEQPTGSLGCIGLKDRLWRVTRGRKCGYNLEEVAQESYCDPKPRVLGSGGWAVRWWTELGRHIALRESSLCPRTADEHPGETVPESGF